MVDKTERSRIEFVWIQQKAIALLAWITKERSLLTLTKQES